MPLGDGVGWDEASPADADPWHFGATEIRDLRKGTNARLSKEHLAFDDDTEGGEHLAGSAVGFFTDTTPTLRPDGVTNLDTSDKGRLWFKLTAPYRVKVWDGTTWKDFSNLSDSYAKLSDVKAASVNGGNFTSGDWRTRTLNTEVDSDGIVTLAASQFVLGTGSYRIRAYCPASKCGSHQAKLRDITNSSDIALGSSEYSNADALYTQTSSTISAEFTVTGNTTFELQHRCETTNTGNGFGQSQDWGNNVYSVIEIWKLAR